jgi:anaerobic magnesium-protoporphyrin IX monomethyl ester cyclase
MAILGAIAKAWGEVRLVDGNVEKITLDRLIKDIRDFAPKLAVINTGFPSINNDMEVARKIKEAFPQLTVIAFGVYFTMLGKEAVAKYPFLDFALSGEPEETFLELGTALYRGDKRFNGIPGILYKEGNVFHQTPPRPLTPNLDRLPHPDRSLLKNNRYRLPHNNRVYTLVNTARGCPHRCTFCIVGCYYGGAVRKHSIQYLLDELRACVQNYGIKDFLFWEEAFALDKKYLLDFCSALLHENLSINWAATTRVDSLDDEIVSAMKKAGCNLLGLGIESSDQNILDRAQKKQSSDGVRHAVALCKKHRLATMGHFVFGLPGETKETAEATIRFMLELGLDYMQCYCAVPYPITALGAEAKEKGWIRAQEWSQYDLGGNSIMSTDTMSCVEVDRFRTKAFRAFYFRPWYILKRLFSGVSVLQLARAADFRQWMDLPTVKKKTSERP